MNRALWGSCLTLGFLAMAVPADGAIIFEATPSFVQPDENLLFNGTDLEEGPSATVQGRTNQTGTVFNLTGEEALVTPASGQARVEDELGAGFTSLFIDALDPDVFYTEFEANLNAANGGTATITATDKAGEIFTFQFDLDGGGQNFFGLQAIDGQLIDTVQILTVADLLDVRQVRLGGITLNGGPGTNPDPSDVPEPVTLVLLGLGLASAGAAARRRHA